MNYKRLLFVKDSWHYPEWEEGELEHEAMDKGVVNVARYYHHEIIRMAGEDDGVCRNVRKELDITKAIKYNVRRPIVSPNVSGLHSGKQKVQSASMVGRKRLSINTSLPPSKCSCSSSQTKDRRNSAEWDRVILGDYGKPIYTTSSLAPMLSTPEGCVEDYESIYADRHASIRHFNRQPHG